MFGPTPDWYDDRACQGMSSVFFPPSDDDLNPTDDERQGEHAAKEVCAACAVSEQCLTAAVERGKPEAGGTGHDPGVWGGANRWERIWMTNASPEQRAEIQALHEELGDDGARRLREWFEEVGPPLSVMDGFIPEQVAVRWGVPPIVAAKWMARAKVGRKHSYGPVLRAILVPLGDGDWTPRMELVRVGIEANEQHLSEIFENGADDVPDRTYRSSPRMVQHALRERKRWNQVEVKEINGEEHLRLRAAPAP